MEQTSLPILSAMRSTTLSSLDWALPRAPMTSCSPVRISRAEVAAESGMPSGYQMRRARVTRALRSVRPAGDLGPIRFALHLRDGFIDDRLVELNSALVLVPPDDGAHRVERTDHHDHVIARRRQVASTQLCAFER